MKKLFLFFTIALLLTFTMTSCSDMAPNRNHQANTSALTEQVQTEINQQQLIIKQPAPRVDWSLERDNLIKRFKLQNNRAVSFFMYVFIEGISDPVGYYQVNKVSSVNSQLTNTEQIINGRSTTNNLPTESIAIIPSPAEDGSYGTNGDAIFGFTPEGIYIETNMKYITSTVPLTFTKPVNRLAVINTEQARILLETSKKAMQ